MASILKKVAPLVLLGSAALAAPLLFAMPPASGEPGLGPDRKLYYYLTDHLGGVEAVVDEEGNVVERADYLPFGQDRARTGSSGEHYGFTGKELDGESGLYYYGARYYDPLTGRFLSEDPIIQELNEKTLKQRNMTLQGYLGNPQGLNSYAYSDNNPLKYVDPDGKLKVHAENATKEEAETFNKALAELTSKVKENFKIQDYFKLFDVDIVETLTDNEKGPDVYLGRKNDTGAEGASGHYSHLMENIDIFSRSLKTQEGTEHTIIHELAHWGNDISDWFGNLDPDLPPATFGQENKIFNELMISDIGLNLAVKFWDDGIYGYFSEILTFGKVHQYQ